MWGKLTAGRKVGCFMPDAEKGGEAANLHLITEC